MPSATVCGGRGGYRFPVPAFRAGAYLLSPRRRSCSYVVPLTFDRVLHRLPFRPYSRRRLHRFTIEGALRSLALGEPGERQSLPVSAE